MTEKIYFAWVNCFGNPFPEKWYGDQRRGNPDIKFGGVDPELVIHCGQISQEEAALSLDELADKYPCQMR